jgi:hypothetical protein
MKEQLKNLMEMLDGVKDVIPEGKYLEMCNEMKNLFEEKPKTTVEWKTHTFEDGHEITINFKIDKSNGYDLTIGKVHYKPHTFVNGVFQPVERKITFNNSMYDDLTIKIEELKAFLIRHFKLVDSPKIEYNYLRKDANNKMHPAYRLFEFETHMKNIIDTHFMQEKINKHLSECEEDDDYDEDNQQENEDWRMSIRCDAESIFYNNVAFIIEEDIENCIHKLFN